MLEQQEQTIAAIATPPGAGGIGIIRLSGPLALPILQHLFPPFTPLSAAKIESHRMYYGWIVEPATQRRIDEVLVVYMRAPRSYTREDVVEIHCHSTFLVQKEILRLVLAGGARSAEAGEFTKRAFLNGRIDLTRAEAVLELLQARTDAGLDLAVSGLAGGLRDQVEAIRQVLLSMRAVLEVAIDFPDDDVEIVNAESMRRDLAEKVLQSLEQLMASAAGGRIFRDGVSAVILGRPNVGKSSLLNTLLREDRAIVTSIPGTTRDIIEEYLDICGVPVRIIDTAGIRHSVEEVEEIGIRKARQKAASADLVLLVIDASQPTSDDDLALLHSIGETPVIVVCNKTDLVPGFTPERCGEICHGRPSVSISARQGTGIRELEEAIFCAVSGHKSLQERPSGCVPNLRHARALEKTRDACLIVEDGLQHALPADLLAIDLQTALDHLGEITGQTTTEDILDHIFTQFCIGK